MLSKKIQNLFLISAILFVAHGLEEYFTGFYQVDSLFYFVFKYFDHMSVFQAIFLLFQIMLWILLAISYMLIFKKDWLLGLVALPAIACITEIHHIVKAAIRWAYYPGSITAVILLVVGYFYWKELLKLYKNK